MWKRQKKAILPRPPETEGELTESDNDPRCCTASSCGGYCEKASSGMAKKVAIVGRPNTGKSHIFTNLTKRYSQSANYPFTTLEEKRACCIIEGQEYEIIDTPGMQGLFINSEEELLVRNLFFKEVPDIIIQCLDANRLKQSLVLTAELMELEVPMVLCLNAIDETARNGTWIDSGLLARMLSVPVVEMVAVNGYGTAELKTAIGQARKGRLNLSYGSLIEHAIEDIGNVLPAETTFRKKRAIFLIRKDPFLLRQLEEECGEPLITQLTKHIETIQKRYDGNISWQIINKRTLWVKEISEKIVKKQKLYLGGYSVKAARWSRDPIMGLPIMLGVLMVIFFSVVNVANRLAGFINLHLWLPLEHAVNTSVSSELLREFLVGHYGVLTLGVSNALLTVLPILSIFFFLFNMLEDSGYIANLCVLLKKVSARVGITGNAVLPVTLAFGCKTMATLTTRSLRSKKEKFIAIYLIAFGIPCAAQMALNMSILGGLGLKALLITFSVLATVWVSVGVTLNAILKADIKEDFILELPPMRLPQLKPVLKKTIYKLHHFLEEAMPIFVGAALLLFTADKTGLLTALKTALKPVITGFLGFPLEMVDVLVLLMAKHEAAAGMLIKLVHNNQLTYIQTIVAVTLTMMFVPCLTNIVAIFKEQGPKKAMIMVVSINVTAIIVAGGLNSILMKFL